MCVISLWAATSWIASLHKISTGIEKKVSEITVNSSEENVFYRSFSYAALFSLVSAGGGRSDA